MTARLLLDEMLSPVIAHQLRDRGHDVTAVAEQPHLTGLGDDEVLDLAAEQGRVLVTLNIADFVALDSRWKSAGRHHAGVVYVATSAFPQDRSFVGAVVNALANAAATGALPGAGACGYLRRVSPTDARPGAG